MIAVAKHKSGSSGSSLGYMLGDMLEKDQQVRVVAYNGFALSRLKITELEKVPTTKEEKKEHKEKVWKIANDLSKIFDARASLADYRVNNPFEDYVISCTDKERKRLCRAPTTEERAKYGMPKLKEGETDTRTLERILLDEFLAKIGVHGKIEKKLRRKIDGKKYTVRETVDRDAMFMAVAHDGTAHPHMHVLTARPDADGKVNDTKNEKRRIVAVVQELSKKYDLSLKLEDYEVDLERTNDGHALKILARDNVLNALETAINHEELTEILANAGVIPTWKVHSETNKEYGILFTKIDRDGNEHTWSGSQLDRSLSYGKIETTLARNLTARQSQEEASRIVEKREYSHQRAEAEARITAQKAEQQKQMDIIAGYHSAVLPVGKQIFEIGKNAFELYDITKKSEIKVSKETESIYERLKDTWKEYEEYNRQSREAKDCSEAVKGMCSILMCLNPIIGLTVMFLVGIINDIMQAEISAQKKPLLSKVESIRNEISKLQKQKTQLKIEKLERLQEYLDAKQMLEEYNEGLLFIDQTLRDARSIDILKEEFPFRDNGHIQYIIHGPHDASIFRAEITKGVYRSMSTGRYRDNDKERKYEIRADYYEEARRALNKKVMFVAGDRGPNDFYETLMKKQKYDNYRVGDMQIHPDGIITFGQERIFGDPKLTEQSVQKIEKLIILKQNPATRKRRSGIKI